MMCYRLPQLYGAPTFARTEEMPNLSLVDRIVEMEKIIEASNNAITQAAQRIKDLVVRCEELEKAWDDCATDCAILNAEKDKQIAKLEADTRHQKDTTDQ